MINVCLFTLANLQNNSALRFILSSLETYTYFYYDHYIILGIHLQITISNTCHVHFTSLCEHFTINKNHTSNKINTISTNIFV
jgi:hypothetical protein